MERKKKKVIAIAVMACSIILLIAYFPITFLTDVDLSSMIFTILVIAYFGSMFAAVKYSENGWRIEGSTLEWIIAAMVAPFLTLILYFVSKNQDRDEAIDPKDHERLQRL